MRITLPSTYQYRFWLEWSLNPASSAYTTPLVFRLSGNLQQEALRQALDAFVHDYDEGCRSIFKADGEQLLRHVAEKVDVAIEFVDASAEARRGQLAEQATQQWIANKTSEVFALDHAPLFRFSLRRIADQQHILVLAFPHIISDAFSAAYIIQCLALLYNHYAAGGPLPVTERADFSDYLALEAQYLDSPQQRQDIAYWRNALEGRQLGVALPSPGAEQEGGWSSHRFALDAGTLAALKSSTKQNRTTLFLVMSSLYAVTLARVYDLNNFIVTYPVNMRPRGFKGASGCYVNNLPMWVALQRGQTLAEVVAQITAQRGQSKLHQQLSLTEMVAALRGAGALAETTIFNVSISEAFFVQDAPITFDGLGAELLPVSSNERPFDLNLAYQVTDDGIALNIEFNRARMSGEQAAAFAASFELVVAAYLREEASGVYAIEVQPVAQRALLEQYWRGADSTADGLNWVERFIAQAARTPDARALGFGGEWLSYRELDEQSARLAAYLRQRGVAAHALVGLCCVRSIEMVLGIVAILRAGAAYVPLDPEAPPERIRQIVSDGGLSVLLTQADCPPHLAGLGLATYAIGDRGQWCSSEPLEYQPIHPDSLAYVIYTSGSTGTPKGVANTHRALINRLDWHGTLLEPGKAPRVLQKTPYYFDVSVWEFLWPLQNGFELLVAPPAIHKDPQALQTLMLEQNIGVVHFVPSMLSAFLDALDGEGAHDFPHLQLVVCSGEALYAEQADLFYRKLPDCRLYNLYGPTEAAIDVSSWACLPSSTATLACVPIGRPIDNVALYVLDSNFDPCPLGVRGMLYIGGAGLARGYVGRADLTAEHFMPDPYAAHAGARMYRSGDLATLDENGVIHYLGRLDEQIKINGNRIELREVEACLLAFPGVALCAVVPVEIDGRIRQLHAYVETVRDTSGWHPEHLHDHVAACLPDYMRPQHIEVLDSMPMLPTGKIDRGRLRRTSMPDDRQAAPPERAMTTFQSEVASEWAAVLKTTQIVYNDNFFMLGGSSIQVIQMTGRINRRYGLLLSPQALFASPRLNDYCTDVLMAIAMDAKQQHRLESLFQQLAPEEMDALLKIVSPSGVSV
ncbi:non-ribosomal peptide synthetase [Janthinobacterium agaricidamnosum]|uniref:PKS-NRPS ORF 1 n=1 Tax=Janthinobacterium agaricidamnosum NBRC 102515 = DSM 9628 TaxID=1349767 RepID=W0V2D9_9BURK|nr:non-ribosomal peptide synthetase [Janthinobacterium agaricidamnosum]CDG82041.1 PKS-NRPS ORF 1 [Janthinobacterium agaricidamnosum NBRC 102515 = DSM 9628]